MAIITFSTVFIIFFLNGCYFVDNQKANIYLVRDNEDIDIKNETTINNTTKSTIFTPVSSLTTNSSKPIIPKKAKESKTVLLVVGLVLLGLVICLTSAVLIICYFGHEESKEVAKEKSRASLIEAELLKAQKSNSPTSTVASSNDKASIDESERSKISPASNKDDKK